MISGNSKCYLLQGGYKLSRLRIQGAGLGFKVLFIGFRDWGSGSGFGFKVLGLNLKV